LVFRDCFPFFNRQNRYICALLNVETLKINLTTLLLLYAAVLILGSSCVPNRKLVYLQNDDLKRRKHIPKDTVLRTHKMDIQESRIQPLDLLSVQFESLTDEQFDFFSKSAPTLRTGGNATTIGLSGIVVDANGEIEYPVVGKVKVSGLTIFEAQNKLKEVASQYLKDVVVRVRILNFRYTLLGEVNGERTVTATNTRLTMMEAIAQAGGLSELADRSSVKVIRQVGDSSEVFYVNLLQEKFIESPYYYVQQNDVIIVPPLRQRTFKRYFISNLGVITTGISAIFFFLSISDRL
jgi:polysaccharide biosynthesis/export protein